MWQVETWWLGSDKLVDSVCCMQLVQCYKFLPGDRSSTPKKFVFINEVNFFVVEVVIFLVGPGKLPYMLPVPLTGIRREIREDIDGIWSGVRHAGTLVAVK